MLKTYRNWIASNYPTPQRALGQCRGAVDKMKMIFPELLEVKGYVTTSDGIDHPHCWCIDLESGEIVDPTAKQFPPPFTYTDLPENHPRVIYPRRLCMQCGQVFYKKNGPFCSMPCEEKFIKEQD